MITAYELLMSAPGSQAKRAQIAFKAISAGRWLNAADCDDEEDRVELAREYLTDNTILLGETPSGFVFQNF